MELRDIIKKVSEMYVDEHGKINGLYEELRDIGRTLDRDDIGDELLLGEYQRLINRKCELQEEISRIKAYTEGISDVRELLMNIGFDIKIDVQKSEELERDLCNLKYQIINDEIFAKVMQEERKR